MGSALLLCVLLTFTLPLTTAGANFGEKKNQECDVERGEVRVPSSTKTSDLEACKKSCEDEPMCLSITFYSNGGCSHFSTTCEITNTIDNAVAMQLKEDPFNNKQCDVTKGEFFESSRKVPSIAACKKTCEDSSKCVSITFYSHGGCDHFTTCCKNTNRVEKAHALNVKDYCATTTGSSRNFPDTLNHLPPHTHRHTHTH